MKRNITWYFTKDYLNEDGEFLGVYYHGKKHAPRGFTYKKREYVPLMDRSRAAKELAKILKEKK